MSKDKSIIILEKSAIIRTGLANLLRDKSKTTYSIDQYIDAADWQLNIKEETSYLLILSPSVFQKNKNDIGRRKQKYTIQTVGLLYAYHHPDSLNELDGLIHLNDAPEKIRSIIDGLLNTPSSSNTIVDDTLSSREKDVLKWIASGYSTKKIADTLFISTHTVNAHRKNIMRKLDIKTISGLTIYAVLNNIISLEEV